jgi:hypothetical protein
MTPKEKAKELVELFGVELALKAVDEILNLNHPLVIVYSEISKNVMTDYTQEYFWQQVKQEIQAL